MKAEWMPRTLIPTVLVIVSAATAPAVANDEQDCFQGKEPPLRIEGCSKIIQRSPNDAVGYHNRGVAYGLAGDIDSAIADYTKVIQIEPNSPTAYENRGRAYASKGDMQNATADATKANEMIAKSKTTEQIVTAPEKPKKAARSKTVAKSTKVAPASSSGWSWLWGNGGK
jgi:tetratricopeptide (TPR) repeat protein